MPCTQIAVGFYFLGIYPSKIPKFLNFFKCGGSYDLRFTIRDFMKQFKVGRFGRFKLQHWDDFFQSFLGKIKSALKYGWQISRREPYSPGKLSARKSTQRRSVFNPSGKKFAVVMKRENIGPHAFGDSVGDLVF